MGTWILWASLQDFGLAKDRGSRVKAGRPFGSDSKGTGNYMHDAFARLTMISITKGLKKRTHRKYGSGSQWLGLKVAVHVASGQTEAIHL